MIISRTPFRISFFGGGTDYPVFFYENGGAVLSTTINKYCYISCRKLPPFFDYNHRIVYSKVETPLTTNDIQHPVVKAAFKYMNVKDGLEIHHDGDLPARAGLGTSSSFTVGLIHCLNALKCNMPNKDVLAHVAIDIEQNVLKENVGSQDQIAAAYGGFNHIQFFKDGSCEVRPIKSSMENIANLKNHLMLYFTGFSRYASEIAKEQIKMTPTKIHELKEMHALVNEAVVSINDADRFGQLLHESWKLKRSLTPLISTPEIDNIYDAAISAGAIGGKLLGAGGGGFMLVYARPENQPKIAEKLNKLLHVPFDFEWKGSKIVVYHPEV